MRLPWNLLALLLISALIATDLEAFGDLTLDATDESIELVTSAAVNTDYRCSYLDNTTTTVTPGNSDGQITTATDTAIVSAPAASTQRKISGCDILNTSTTTDQTVTVMFDKAGTERLIHITTLKPRWSLHWSEGRGWFTTTSTGQIAKDARAGELRRYETSGILTIPFGVVGTSPEAGAFPYDTAKDGSLPPAWTPGTPGLNGDAVTCSSSADATIAGSWQLRDAPGGKNWRLRSWSGHTGTSVGTYILRDLLWYNTGIVVTTTGAQAITHPGIPARDINGTTNGEGVFVGLYATTATTNGGVITNTTISYTDSDGNAGNTGTIAAWNSTTVVGTVVWFQLADGDRGVRSVESITLGTSYVTGALSLLQFRPVQTTPSGGYYGQPTTPLFYIFSDAGPTVWNGSCLKVQVWPANIGSEQWHGTAVLTAR